MLLHYKKGKNFLKIILPKAFQKEKSTIGQIFTVSVWNLFYVNVSNAEKCQNLVEKDKINILCRYDIKESFKRSDSYSSKYDDETDLEELNIDEFKAKIDLFWKEEYMTLPPKYRGLIAKSKELNLIKEAGNSFNIQLNFSVYNWKEKHGSNEELEMKFLVIKKIKLIM